MNNRRGYCIFIDTVFQGPVPAVWESGPGDFNERLCLFETEREAQLEIVDFMETRLQQFKDGKRDYDDAIAVEEYVVAVEILPDGKIVVIEEPD